MKGLVLATVVLAVALAPAFAEQRYDKRLEAAAIGIVIGKMGAIRDGFDPAERPDFVTPIDPARPTHLSAKSPSSSVETTGAERATESSFLSY